MTNKHTPNLVAAAPDLLRTLKETLRCLAWHQVNHGVGLDAVVVEQARAAIAQAEETNQCEQLN